MSVAGVRRPEELRDGIAWKLLGPSGECWDAARVAQDIAAVFHQRDVSPDMMVDDLVSGRGYAATQTTPSACHVKVCPAMIRPATLELLESTVAQQRSQLIIGRYYFDRWHIRLHVCKTEFLEFLNAAVDREQSQETDVIRSRAISPLALTASATPTLAEVMQLIRSRDGRLDYEMLAIIAKLTKQRFLICRWHADAHIWQIEHSGTGYTKHYVDLARNRIVGTQPAFQYGCWLHERYLEVMDRNAPVVEDIDAMVRATGLAPKRLTYRRILSPITGIDGSRLLLSASMDDRSIDLGSATGIGAPI